MFILYTFSRINITKKDETNLSEDEQHGWNIFLIDMSREVPFGQFYVLLINYSNINIENKLGDIFYKSGNS